MIHLSPASPPMRPEDFDLLPEKPHPKEKINTTTAHMCEWIEENKARFTDWTRNLETLRVAAEDYSSQVKTNMALKNVSTGEPLLGKGSLVEFDRLVVHCNNVFKACQSAFGTMQAAKTRLDACRTNLVQLRFDLTHKKPGDQAEYPCEEPEVIELIASVDLAMASLAPSLARSAGAVLSSRIGKTEASLKELQHTIDLHLRPGTLPYFGQHALRFELPKDSEVAQQEADAKVVVFTAYEAEQDQSTRGASAHRSGRSSAIESAEEASTEESARGKKAKHPEKKK